MLVRSVVGSFLMCSAIWRSCEDTAIVNDTFRSQTCLTHSDGENRAIRTEVPPNIKGIKTSRSANEW